MCRAEQVFTPSFTAEGAEAQGSWALHPSSPSELTALPRLSFLCLFPPAADPRMPWDQLSSCRMKKRGPQDPTGHTFTQFLALWPALLMSALHGIIKSPLLPSGRRWRVAAGTAGSSAQPGGRTRPHSACLPAHVPGPDKLFPHSYSSLKYQVCSRSKGLAWGDHVTLSLIVAVLSSSCTLRPPVF